MVDAHRFLPSEPSSGDELSKILEKRKAISERKVKGKQGNFAGGSKTVSRSPKGFPGGIRARGGSRTVHSQIQSGASSSKGKIQDKHTLSGPKQRKNLSASQKREMLVGLKMIGKEFVPKAKAASAAHIKDSPPPSPRTDASTVVHPPMGGGSSSAPKKDVRMEEHVSVEPGVYTEQEREQNRIVERFGIGDPDEMRELLNSVDIDRVSNLQSSLVSMNTKLFAGGVGSEKVKDMNEIRLGLDIQGRNVKLAILKGILSGNLTGTKNERKDMASLVDTYEEMAALSEALLPRETFSQLSNRKKKRYMKRLNVLMNRAEKIEGNISQPLELKIAAVTTKTSCMKLINTIADTMDNPDKYKIIPKRAW